MWKLPYFHLLPIWRNQFFKSSYFARKLHQKEPPLKKLQTYSAGHKKMKLSLLMKRNLADLMPQLPCFYFSSIRRNTSFKSSLLFKEIAPERVRFKNSPKIPCWGRNNDPFTNYQSKLTLLNVKLVIFKFFANLEKSVFSSLVYFATKVRRKEPLFKNWSNFSWPVTERTFHRNVLELWMEMETCQCWNQNFPVFNAKIGKFPSRPHRRWITNERKQCTQCAR